MAERGIDIGDQRPKGLQEFIGTAQSEYVITVCDRAEKACPMFPGKGLVSASPLQARQEPRVAAKSAWPSSVRCATTLKRASAAGCERRSKRRTLIRRKGQHW